ncbi:restriction endonuclease subunit S [Vibrio cholerae]|uniref:restriction endonuclease subunit S n=1 Tax=Vibrio cholerae TaxID=666 RepID=UPI0002A321E5|nr:restriction endonuclease subunit S [Vibrio cholerae]EKY31835.1 Type I restriction-modification system, specificity subunit S [Vibrio cholerae PS15]
MGSSWKRIPLGDLISLQRGHDLPSQSRVEGGVPIMGSSGLTGWHNTSKCKGPGVVVGRSGNSMGVVSYSESDFWPLNTCLYVTDFKGNDVTYIYYMLQQINFDQFNSGSAQKSLNRNAVYPFEVLATEDKDEQRRIGKLLSDFERKITLNRQINQTLEQMAQTLFKSWFVDFDPVIDNALDAGNPIPDELQHRAEARNTVRESEGFKPLPDDVRQLFPDAFEESELGWVPKGWEVEALDSIADFQNGLALQKFRPESEDDDFLPVLKIAQLRQGYCEGKEKSRTDIKESCRVYNGDMIFSWSGTLMIDLWTGGNAALNQHLYKVTSKKFPQSFYLHWTKHHLARFQHIAAAKAVTMGHIKKGDLSDSKCLVPSSELIDAFDEYVGKYLKQSINVRLQCNTLVELRDTLLPKLISGELRLDEVELAVEQEAVSTEQQNER